MHKLPNLTKSRHGIFYIRHYSGGNERRFSLRTKNWNEALAIMLSYHQQVLSMKKFDIALPNGVEIKNINSDNDLDRLLKYAQAENMRELIETLGEKINDFPTEGSSSDPLALAVSHQPQPLAGLPTVQ